MKKTQTLTGWTRGISTLTNTPATIPVNVKTITLNTPNTPHEKKTISIEYSKHGVHRAQMMKSTFMWATVLLLNKLSGTRVSMDIDDGQTFIFDYKRGAMWVTERGSNEMQEVGHSSSDDLVGADLSHFLEALL